MDENFELLNEEEKNTTAYRACVLGTTLTGVAVGRFGGLQGILVGGLAGLAYGLVGCKYINKQIKEKLFSSTAKLRDDEIKTLLSQIRTRHSTISKKNAIELLANVRLKIAKNKGKYRSFVS